MKAYEVEFDYSDADFFNETPENLSPEDIAEYLFESRRSAVRAIVDIVNSTDDVSLPEMPLDVFEVRVSENTEDNDCLNIYIRIQGLDVAPKIEPEDLARRYDKHVVGTYDESQIAIRPA